MADIVTLQAQARTGKGGRASAKLRKKGLIPGVVYGHKEPNAEVAVSAEELDRIIRVQHVRTLSLSVDGKAQTVLIKEVQWDHLGRDMIHVDFLRKDASERVKVTVAVELRNAPKQTGGGVLDHPIHVLHVECAFSDIPKDPIRVDVTNLTVGHPIHVRELTVPPALTVLDNPETVVVQLRLPGAEEIAEAAEIATPEVIKKEGKKAGDEEESK